MLRAASCLVIPCLLLGCDSPAPPAPTPTASPLPSASVAASPLPSASAASPTAAPAEAPTRIAVQHVLVTYKGAKDAPKSVSRSKADAKTRADQVRDKARGGTDFSALVAEYTEDPGSKDRQGSLGMITKEKVVEPFAKAAFVLPVDGVSDVVETPFGFHVIKRNQ